MRARERVVVTGGAGLVGRALLRRLVQEGRPVTALDQRDPGVPGADFRRGDVLTDPLEQALAGARVVIHLVARVDPPLPSRRAAMRHLHEEGTRRVLAAAEAAGVQRLVLCSSAVVYGARPGNPVPFTEDSPVRPLPYFPYALDKALQEQLVLAASGRMEVAIARPAIIYGREAKNYLTEILRMAPGVLPAIDGRRPPLQFVHVDDVAGALAALAESPVCGTFNVASRGLVTFEGVARAAGLRVMAIPRRALAPVLSAGQWVVPSWARAPAFMLDHLSYPFVVSAARLEREVGFTPSRSTEDALVEMLEGRRRRLSLRAFRP